MIGGYQIVDLKHLDIDSTILSKETELKFKTDKVILLQNFIALGAHMTNVFLHKEDDAFYSSVIFCETVGANIVIKFEQRLSGFYSEVMEL